MLKTHTCGQLRAEHVGQEVTLAGWVNRRRDQGGLIFIDLRDRWGVTQITINAQTSPTAHAAANNDVRSEYVIQVTGRVRTRPEGTANPELDTGAIELEATAIKVLNTAKTTPFSINTDDKVDESLRLKYRYLDLRRTRMQHNILLRGRVIQFMRNYLYERAFTEIETPIMFKTTPEGAREYLVPSRTFPGKFYALTQSPQQFKQLLMVAGYEKYFQIARCFRDEDQRGDRQPEFTQLDLEMSFVEREDVLRLIEDLMIAVVEKLTDKKIMSKPFVRLTYQESMLRYGCDKPDVRFGLEIVDISDIAGKTGFKVFTDNVAAGRPVRAIRIPGAGSYSRKQLGDLEELAKNAGAKGLAWMAIEPSENGQVRSPIGKFFAVDQLETLLSRMQAQPGDLLLFASDKESVVCSVLDNIRREFGARLNLTDPNTMAFAWVIDFPLVEWNEDEKRWNPSHHLFTAPMTEDIPLMATDPGKVRGQQYDLACNGYEVAGGSIRIHERAMQERIFELISLDMSDAQQRFGHLLEAFEYGTPPHGGVASGLDRLLMLLCNEPNIRESIAFPKNQSGVDLMVGAPSEAAIEQLNDLSIAVKLPEAKPGAV